MLVLFSDISAARRRELASAVGHYIAGVLDRNVMTQMIVSLCENAALQPGMRVQTLRGITHGVVVRLLDDGRVLWRTAAGTELIALPETLTTEV